MVRNSPRAGTIRWWLLLGTVALVWLPVAVPGDGYAASVPPREFQFQDTWFDRVTRVVWPSRYWRSKMEEAKQDLDQAYREFQEHIGRYREKRREIMNEIRSVRASTSVERRQARLQIVLKHRAELDALRQKSRLAGHQLKHHNARLVYAERTFHPDAVAADVKDAKDVAEGGQQTAQ